MDNMTVIDALKITVNLLGSIAVPRNLNNQVGMPIDDAIVNIQLCIEALENSKKIADEHTKSANTESKE